MKITHSTLQRIFIIVIWTAIFLLRPGPPALAQSPDVTDVEAALAEQPTVRVIVVLHPVEAGPEMAAQVAESQQAILQNLPPEDFRVIHPYQTLPGLVGEVTPAGLEALRQQPDVAAIALDLPVEAADMTPSAIFIGGEAVRRDFGLTGAGVNVAVLDTGVDTSHVDLAGAVIAQHCYNRNGGCQPDGATESDSAQDENGHGSHVAGVIVGRGQSSPLGLASGAGLVAVRVLGRSGSGFSSDVLAGLDWVVAHQAQLNVKAMNLSLGGGSYSGNCDQADANTMLYAAAVQAARQSGIAVFAASGNSAQADALMAPACISGVMAVGNVYDAPLGSMSWPACLDQTVTPDQVVCASNSGSELDLLAPGVAVQSVALGGGQTGKSGTSISTPHAVAVAALLWQAQPNLTPDEVETILKETGVPVTDARNGRVTPRLDALAAVTRVVVGEVDPIWGVVLLQGRTDHSGVKIYLSDQPCSSTVSGEPADLTNVEGRFTLTPPAEPPPQCLQAVQPGYLMGQKEWPQDKIGQITLAGGDVVPDNLINILDLAFMAIHYNTTEPQADVNADGLVDIFDLTIAASNYNLRGPVTDWQ